MCLSISVCVERYFCAGCPQFDLVRGFFGSGNYIYAHCLRVSVFKLAGVEDWRDKIVYLCADGLIVNLGKDNGVGIKIGATRSSTCAQTV